MRIVPIICAIIAIGTVDVAHAQPDRIESFRTPTTSSLTEFWTPQRLQDAHPMPLPTIDASELGATGPAEPKSEPLQSGAGKASRHSGDVQKPPLNLAGRLFFTTGKGQQPYCSAQFIASGVLVTAAHCVRDNETGQWYSKFIYVHQYFRGNGTKYDTDCSSMYNGWVSRDVTHLAWDYAMIKLRGGTDQGYFGLESGWWGRHNTVPKIGYPHGVEQGEVIQVQFGRLIRGHHPFVVGLKYDDVRDPGGSSGGAWVGKYEPTRNPQANRIISVESHGTGEKGISYGPYWGGPQMVKLKEYVAAGCRS